jgi:hypothetical protein
MTIPVICNSVPLDGFYTVGAGLGFYHVIGKLEPTLFELENTPQLKDSNNVDLEWMLFNIELTI